jgi:hypothetical protein
MHLSNINGGSGLSIAPPVTGNLQPFTANVTANIDAAQAIPEPATSALLVISFSLTLASTRSRVRKQFRT